MSSASSTGISAGDVVDDFASEVDLRVSWGGVSLIEGCTLTPTQVCCIPAVCFEGPKDKLYTIILR